MATSWTDFLCCPRKADRHPEAEAYDGPGGTQPVACAPSVTDSSEKNKVLQHTTSDLHGTKPGAGLAAASDGPEQSELSAQTQATNALSPELELLYEKRIQDLEDELNLVLRRNKELSARVCELEDLMFPEIERTSWAENQPSDRLKEQLGKSLKDKRGQERRALKAEENLRDLKHQNAVLQKRLYQAGSLSPGHVSMPPVPPPLSSSAIGPMFSVLRNTTIKLGPVIPQESAEVSGLVQENGESGSPSSMNEVLEKIRSGVALRPVTPPMKSTVTLVAGIKLKSPTAGSGSQFEGTVPKQQVESTDIMLDGPSTSAVSMAQACSSPTQTTEMRKSPGNEHNPCALEEMENPGSASDSGEAPGSSGSTDDEGSTSSTLPVTSDHSAEDDQDTDPDVELEHGSDSKNSWVGSHRQKQDEPLVHLEAPVEPVASDTETSVDISYLEVDKSTVVLSEQNSDKTGNEGHAETILSFCPTKCITGFSFHVSSGKELDQHSSSSGGRDGANPSSHVNIADTLALVKCGDLDSNLATLAYQSSDGVTCVPSESSLSARHDSTQANILEIEDDLPVDAVNGKDGVCSSKDTEVACSIISVQSHGEPTDTTSSPKLEDIPLAQTLDMLPLIGSVQEDELSQVSGKPPAVYPHNVQQFLADVSSENRLAVTGLKSQKAEDCTSTESIFEPCADIDVATSTDSGFF